jgi:hypothetical protein
MGFDITDQLLIRFFCICQTLDYKSGYTETVRQLSIDIKKAYYSVRREVVYNILMEF